MKLGVDGGFEGGLMREPYEEPWGEDGTFHGLQTVPREPLISMVRTLHAAGWRVATHAVGDAAIDLVLDAYEAANGDAPIAGLRWVIEHGFIPREDHFSRMRALGVAVSAQDHLYLAAPSLVEYWGEHRAAWTTPVRAYLDAGIPISLGTDSPVVPYDPWWVLHHFTTRETISAGVVGEGSAHYARRGAPRGHGRLRPPHLLGERARHPRSGQARRPGRHSRRLPALCGSVSRDDAGGPHRRGRPHRVGALASLRLTRPLTGFWEPVEMGHRWQVRAERG